MVSFWCAFCVPLPLEPPTSTCRAAVLATGPEIRAPVGVAGLRRRVVGGAMATATDTRQLLLATTNPNKVREVREVLGPLVYEVRSLDALAEVPPEPVEDAATF